MRASRYETAQFSAVKVRFRVQLKHNAFISFFRPPGRERHTLQYGIYRPVCVAPKGIVFELFWSLIGRTTFLHINSLARLAGKIHGVESVMKYQD